MLLTKFYLPELRPNRVARPRLLQILDQPSKPALVIVSAPAGFGKTSLVSEWVRAGSRRAAWLSLDESDNDPAQFWPAFLNAAAGLFPSLPHPADGAPALPVALQAAASQRVSARPLLVALLNQLATRAAGDCPPPPACLVLDDIHHVTDPSIFADLLFLIERLPPCLQIVLIGRSDPPLPLGRLRAGGRLLELRAADLRFTLQESLEFLNHVMRLPLTPAQVRRLDERTEGWVVGLQLAGLAMQAHATGASAAGIAAFIHGFSGDDRFILDYLVEEVLNRLPAAARDFLLHTAILDRLCGPLCDAVAGLPPGSGQAMLEQLERDNLFLVPLDNRRQWYRYHHLFADLLRHQRERHPLIPTAVLHRRAAAWLAGQQLLPDAIHHALRAEDYDAAAAWIEAHSRASIAQGAYAQLAAWVEALPREIRYARPDLLLRYAWALAFLGRVDQYDEPLSAAENLFRRQGNPVGLAQALNLRADFAATVGDGPAAARLARQALDLLPEEDQYDRGMSLIYLGCAAYLQNDNAAAREALIAALALCRHSQNTTGARLAAMTLAQVYQAQGDLPQAAALLEDIRDQAGGLPIYEALGARMLLAMLWREWDRLDDAEKALREVLETVEATGQVIYFSQAYLHLAAVLWEKGDLAGMRQAFERHAALARQIGDPRVSAIATALAAQFALLSGDPAPARRWLAESAGQPEEPVGYLNQMYHLLRARLLLRGDEDAAARALDLLDALRSAAHAQQREGSLPEIDMLAALAWMARKDLPRAFESLRQSLAAALPAGCCRLYLDEGQPLFDLLALLIHDPNLPPDVRAYATRLLQRAPARPAVETARAANLALVEPLTPRELEVLRLLRDGMSNREIAEKLYLTLNTVKVHLKNIFAKLQVENRTQAVRQAQQIGLL